MLKRRLISVAAVIAIQVGGLAFPGSALADELTAEEKAALAALQAAQAKRAKNEVKLNLQWIIAGATPDGTSSGTSRSGPSPGTENAGMSALDRWLYFIRRLPECQGDMNAAEECRMPPADPAAPAAAIPGKTVVSAAAREVILSLQLPAATPQVGPDPSANEWDMAVVGFPLWLWTNGDRALTTTRTAYGITFTLRATQRSTVFTMGDGNSVTCGTTQPYPATIKAGTPSPVCGYAYQKGKAKKATYHVTATTHWDVEWSALGYTGSMPAQMTAGRDLPVGELQSVLTG